MTGVFVLLTKCRKAEMIKLTPSENLLVMNKKFVSCKHVPGIFLAIFLEMIL